MKPPMALMVPADRHWKISPISAIRINGIRLVTILIISLFLVNNSAISLA